MTLIKRGKHYSAVIRVDGHQKWFATGSADKPTARKRAKEYFTRLREGRWTDAERLRLRRSRVITIGRLLEHYTALAGIRLASIKSNANSMRLIVREVTGEDADQQPITVLNGALLSDFEKIRQKKTIGVKAMHAAKRTVFSTVRQAKSVFSALMLQRFADKDIQLPPCIQDFITRKVENGPRVRYKAPRDRGLAARTLAAARTELRVNDREAYLMFLLAFFAGMRRSEIANARMEWLRDHSIEIQPDGDFDTKNSTEREIKLAPDVYHEVRQLTKGRTGYLLDGPKTARAEKIPDRLNAWLSGKGWTHSNKRMHELRRHFGSEVSKIAGLHAAQHLLGHKDISTTDRFYADPTPDVALEG